MGKMTGSFLEKIRSGAIENIEAEQDENPSNVVSVISPTGHRLLYLFNAARSEGHDGIIGSKFALASLAGGVSLKTMNRALRTLQFEKSVRVDDKGGVVAIIASESDLEAPVCIYLR